MEEGREEGGGDAPLNRYYILENGLPKSADLFTWARWLDGHPDRNVKRTEIPGAGVKVITVFLPLYDLDFLPDGTPVKYFYGTLVRGGAMDEHEEKNVSREEAEDTHERLVKRVTAVWKGHVGVPDCCKKKSS